MNKKKDSFGAAGSGTGANKSKRKSSLGLRSWMSGGDNERFSDVPSTSRPQPMQRSNSNSGMQNRSNEFSSSNRIPRLAPPSYTSRRSSSQEPPSYRRQLAVTSPASDMQHMSNVGVLLTPVRPSLQSHSPMSIASSARNSSARRISQKMQISGPIPKMREERPITDKNFQSNAINKVHSFVRNAGGQIMKLKPMSNTALISTFNIIISQIDPTMNVTSSNYVEAIPRMLCSLQYPTSISKSSFVAVGSGHATQQIIAMLAWLVDSVEALTNVNPETCLFPNADVNDEEKILRGSYLTLFEAYGQFKQGVSSTDEHFMEIFCRNTGDSMDSENEVQTEIEDYKAKLEGLRMDPVREENEGKLQQLSVLETEVIDLQKLHDGLSEQTKSKKNKVAQLRETVKQLDIDLGRLDDQAAEIQDQIENQQMKAAERDNIKTQCEILRESIMEKNSYLEKLQGLIGKVDISMANARKKVGNITQDINCLVLEKGYDESLKWMHNPLHTDTATDYILHMQQLWSAMLQSTAKELEDKQATLRDEHQDQAKLRENIQKKKNQLDNKIEETRRIGAEMVTLQLESSETEQKMREDIEKEKAACCKLQEMLNRKPNLADVEESIKAILDEKQTLAEGHQKFKTFVETKFFPLFLKITQDWQQDVSDELVKLLEKYQIKKIGNCE